MAFKPRTRLLQFGVAGIAAAFASIAYIAPAREPEQAFEMNVTGDLAISSGEPQIAVDPTNPRRLAIVEFGVGSAKRPAYSYNPMTATALMDDPEGQTEHTGRVMLSTDGGYHWTAHAPVAYDPTANPHTGGGDPFIAYGPDGTLYVGGEAGPLPGKGRFDVSKVDIFLTRSTDAGKTFSPSLSAGTPADRPWIAVDRTDGTVYTASTGPLNLATGIHNRPGPGAPNDRWLVAWKPHLTGKSKPRQIGGPDFSSNAGSTLTAAHGVVAATFLVGPPTASTFGQIPPPPPTVPGPIPVPASLAALVPPGLTTCSLKEACLFFETSADQGEHWTRHYVPVAGGIGGKWVNVAADPGRPGRYAVALLGPDETTLKILVTNDSGTTWSAPVTIAEKAQGVDFKYWLDYGPTGVLGIMWKKQRDDLMAGQPTGGPGEAVAPAFDVYSTISCDGGMHWFPPTRMNAKPSLAGPAGHDDLSYIALDAHNAHMVWGDRRNMPHVNNVPGGIGGIQAYYGRLPFSAASHGTSCGRHG